MLIYNECSSFKFTEDHSDTVQKKITHHLETITKKILSIFEKKDLEALVLGGSYARGEGRVFYKNSQKLPFDNYDLYIVCKDISSFKKNKYKKKASLVLNELNAYCGNIINIHTIVNLKEIKNIPKKKNWIELKLAHLVLYGNKNVLCKYKFEDFSSLPLIEEMKLLLNCGTNLLMLKEELRKKGFSFLEKEALYKVMSKIVITMCDTILVINNNYCHKLNEKEFLLNKSDLKFCIEKKTLVNLYKKFKINLITTDMILTRREFEIYYEKVISCYKKIYYLIFSKYYKNCIVTNKDLLDTMRTKKVKSNKLTNILSNLYSFKFQIIDLRWYMKDPEFRLFLSLPYFLFNCSGYEKDEINKVLGLSTKQNNDVLKTKFFYLCNKYL